MNIFGGEERNNNADKVMKLIDRTAASNCQIYTKGFGTQDRSIDSVLKDQKLPISMGNYTSCWGVYCTISSFILVKGLEGTQGTRGGNAGSGGCGGLGGFPGEITIKGLHKSKCYGAFSVKIRSGQAGADGNDGKRGQVF